MSVLKMAFALVVKNAAPLGQHTSKCSNPIFKQHGRLTQMFSATCLISNVQSRSLSTQDVTKNIQYISNDKGVNLEKDPKTMKLVNPFDRPLCIMLNWMLAKQKHVHKYAAIYLDQGYDVLSVNCTPWQLLWPMKGSQLVASDLLRFLNVNDMFNPLILHGFSVGGYMWGEVCMHVSNDKPKYQPTLDRIVAQIWDSAADISEMEVGIPRAVFPKNQVMQNALKKYFTYHFKTFHEVATIHYMRSSQQFHRNLCKAPALFFVSKTDPVGAEQSNRRVHDSWESMGIKTSWKCWDKSPHVQHFTKHPKEYVRSLNDHLDGLGLISQPEKIRMRL